MSSVLTDAGVHLGESLFGCSYVLAENERNESTNDTKEKQKNSNDNTDNSKEVTTAHVMSFLSVS